MLHFADCVTLQWRHNGRGSVSNHQLYDCLLNRWFRRRSKKTSKLRVTGLCAGNSPGTGQMASNAENGSIWWRHPVCTKNLTQHARGLGLVVFCCGLFSTDWCHISTLQALAKRQMYDCRYTMTGISEWITWISSNWQCMSNNTIK